MCINRNRSQDLIGRQLGAIILYKKELSNDGDTIRLNADVCRNSYAIIKLNDEYIKAIEQVFN
jgi:hypothetical protein